MDEGEEWGGRGKEGEDAQDLCWSQLLPEPRVQPVPARLTSHKPPNARPPEMSMCQSLTEPWRGMCQAQP